MGTCKLVCFAYNTIIMLLNSLIIYILKNIRFLIVKNKILENLELQLLAITSLISF